MREMHTDIAVIGAGPAGLQLGYDLEKQGRDYVVLERADHAGAFFDTMPRRRTLISINKRYTGYDDPERNLRWDWNSLLTDDYGLLMTEYSDEYLPHPDALVRYLSDFAERYVPRIRYGCAVTAIARDGDGFRVETATGETWRARAVVIATGFSKPFVPGVRGIELAEQYATFDNDPDGFAGKRVLIIGKGNSGFETADQILHRASLIHIISRGSIKFAWNTHHPGDLRAINVNLLDSYQLKVQNALLDAAVTRLRRTDDGRIAVSVAYAHARGEIEEIVYDRVICCTGFKLDDAIFDPDIRPETAYDGRFPQLTPEFESVNVPGLFWAGTLTQSLDYKKTNSAFIHGFRYNARALSRFLGQRYYDEPLPHRTLDFSVRGLTDHLLRRINRASSLWQQFGFICDAAILDGEQVRYYEDLPIDYVNTSELARADQYYTLTLEFGAKQTDVFAVERHPDLEAAAASFFLHPVIRFFSRGVLVRTHHLLENLFGEWEHQHLHVRPLLEFIGSNWFPPDSLLSAVEDAHRRNREGAA